MPRYVVSSTFPPYSRTLDRDCGLDATNKGSAPSPMMKGGLCRLAKQRHSAEDLLLGLQCASNVGIADLIGSSDFGLERKSLHISLRNCLGHRPGDCSYRTSTCDPSSPSRKDRSRK